MSLPAHDPALDPGEHDDGAERRHTPQMLREQRRARSPRVAAPTPHPADLLSTERPARKRGRGPGGRGPSDVRPRPGHIPGLDGIRAIAIIGVLIFHFTPSVLPGGFLGVDVFFVLSGFLITTLLLREIDKKGRIDLLGFWRRRARRLLPALVLVVVTSVAAARLIGGDLLVGIGRQTLGALTFTTNWLEIGAGASYFHSTSPILFVNFWSLAVEEQFYLIWPLALVVVLALTRTGRQRIGVVAGIGVVSTILMAVLYRPGADATRVYYGTDTHLMGLMAGAAFAIAWANPAHRAGLRSPVWRRWRWAAVLGAFLVLAALMRWMGESSPLTFRGGILLASLATLVLIAGLLESHSPWRRVMELRPLGWLGERSYGIYLWHWPVLIIMGTLVPYARGTGHGAVVLGTALGITLVLATLSHRFVETPVRRHGLRASLRQLGAWLTTPWSQSKAPRIIAGILALALIATAVAIATAPDKSATQAQIEATEARLAEGGAGAAEGSGAEAREGSSGGTVDGSEGVDAGGALGLTADSDDDKGAQKGDESKTSEAKGEDPKDAEAKDEDAAKEKKDLPAGAVSINGSTFAPDEDGLLVPSGSELSAVGDSLIVTSSDGLTYRFPDINYLAKSNRQWGDGEALIAAGIQDGTVRDNVVLHLGSNAGVDEKALRRTLEELGPDRNVVIMDLYVNASFTESSNATIAKVADEYPNVVVGRWNATISQRPQDLQSDQVHPDLDGMHLYAEVVAKAFDELATQG